MEQSTEKPFIVTALDKGWQSKTTKFLNQESELLFAKNVDLDYKIGGVAKSYGYEQLGNDINSSGNVLGVGTLNLSSGTEKILAFSGTDAYVYNSGTGAWDAQSRTFTAAQTFYTASVLEYLIEVNGITDAPQSWTGSAWSTSSNVTDMPKAKYIIFLNGRVYLFYVNIAIGGTFPSMVWFSDLVDSNLGTSLTWGFESGTDLAQTISSAVVTSAGSLFKTRNIKIGDDFFITTGTNAGRYTVKSVDSETQITLTVTLAASQTSKEFWCGGNYFFVDRDNSDYGMGLGGYGNRLLCFKRFSLSVFTKTNSASTDTIIPVRGAPGTTSQKSVVNVGTDTYYFSDTGIWKFDGLNATLISIPVQEVIDGITASNKTSVVGWQEKDRIVKMYVGDVSNTDTDLSITKCVICHDSFKNAWWTEEYPDTVVASTRWLNSDNINSYIFSSTGEALKTNTGSTYDGGEINMEFETHPYFVYSPEVEVTYTRFKIFGRRIRDVQVYYKLWYYEQGKIDIGPRIPGVLYKSDNEIELVLKNDDPMAAGFSLLFKHSSSDEKPLIERFVAYHRGNNLRHGAV